MAHTVIFINSAIKLFMPELSTDNTSGPGFGIKSMAYFNSVINVKAQPDINMINWIMVFCDFCYRIKLK